MSSQPPKVERAVLGALMRNNRHGADIHMARSPGGVQGESMKWLMRMLSGAPSDPTSDWPNGSRVELVWDTAARTLNGVGFAEPLDGFRHLGRADYFRSRQAPRFQLGFAQSGVILQFEKDSAKDHFGLDYLGIYIAHDDQCELGGPVEFATLRLAPSGVVLGPETTEADLVSLFGEPHRADRERDTEHVLFHLVDGVEHEFEFLPGKAGGLKRINLYPSVP